MRWPVRRDAGGRPTERPRTRWWPPRTPAPQVCPLRILGFRWTEGEMTRPLSLPTRVGVVNVGLPLFGDAIREQGAPVVSVDWRVPAGGQPAAVAALGRLYGIHAERIDAANAEVLRRLDRGIPLLTGITTVAEAVPGLAGAAGLRCGRAIG